MRGVLVVPSRVKPPDISEDKFGLVVDRFQVRPVEESVGDLEGVDNLVETFAGVDSGEAVVDDGFQQAGGVIEGAVDVGFAETKND